MPSAPSSRSVIVAFVVGAAIGAAAVLLLNSEGAKRSERLARRVVARAQSPDKSKIALAWETACGAGVCTELALGPSEANAVSLGEKAPGECDEIIWTHDGKRIAFLMDGIRLAIYDAQTAKQAGIVSLMNDEASLSRLARGITFSDNGRAVTFDDCPRGQSGCRAGVVGVPQ